MKGSGILNIYTISKLWIWLTIALSSGALLSAEHIVSSGESLMTISHRYYQTHKCWRLIRDEKKQKVVGESIEVGQKLFIPEKSECALLQPWILKASSSAGLVKNKKKVSILEKEDRFIIFNEKGEGFKMKPLAKRKPLKKQLKKTVIEKKFHQKNYEIQIAAFSTWDEAYFFKNQQEKKIQEDMRINRPMEGEKIKWYRLKLGHFLNSKQAMSFANKMGFSKQYPGFFITKGDGSGIGK